MLSLRTPPGGNTRLRGAEGAVWRDKTLDNIERDSIQTEWQYHMAGNYCGGFKFGGLAIFRKIRQIYFPANSLTIIHVYAVHWRLRVHLRCCSRYASPSAVSTEGRTCVEVLHSLSNKHETGHVRQSFVREHRLA